MIPSCRTQSFGPPSGGWTPNYFSQSPQNAISNFEDITHDAHDRLLFDFPSPYAYLAHTQLPQIAAEHGATIVYHPFRILDLMKIVGNRPTTIECKNKSKYAGADLQRWVKRYEVDFSRNPNSKSFDFAELDRGALVAIEDGRGAEYVAAIFAAIWGQPEDLSQRSVLTDVLSRAGFDGQRLLERASAEAAISQLDAETKAAAERGIFGAPTIFVGDQMFFGNDRLDFVVEALRYAA